MQIKTCYLLKMISVERTLRVSIVICFVSCVLKKCNAVKPGAAIKYEIEHRSNDINTLETFYRNLPEIAAEPISHSCPASDAHLRVCTSPTDCEDYFHFGYNTSGVYRIWPRNKIMNRKSILVYCDMDTDGGGWTVLQRRGNYSRSEDYFFKDWDSYKKGFGDIEMDFWLGNDNIFALTNQKLYSIRFDLSTVTRKRRYALYDIFHIEDEDQKYKLTIEDYSGTAGDSMKPHNKQKFTTKDQDNDEHKEYNCAERFKGAWWYSNCHSSNLNGLYLRGKTEKHGVGVTWLTLAGHNESLDKTEIKIRPRDFQKC